jgi:Fe2+ transport system protein FeoA
MSSLPDPAIGRVRNKSRSWLTDEPTIPPETPAVPESPRKTNKLDSSPRRSAPVSSTPTSDKSAAFVSPTPRSPSEGKKGKISRRSTEAKSALNEKLLSVGFIPKSWVYIEDENGTSSLGLIKADALGHPVFIDVDTPLPTSHSVSENDIKLRKSIKGSVMPVDEVIESSRCADLSFCSAAYQCKDGVCMVNRNPKTLDLELTDYLLTEKESVASISDQDPALMYPVIKLSQIYANGDVALRTIEAESNKYRVRAAAEMWKRNLAFKVAAERLSKAASILANDTGAFKLSHNNLVKIVEQSTINRNKIKFPPTDVNRDSFNNAVRNLSVCSELYDKLIIKSGYLVELTDNMERMTAELEKILADLKSTYTL